MSYIADGWRNDHPQWGSGSQPIITYTQTGGVSQEEFNKLKVEMESLKKLLIAAKIYDDETDQPDCEMEDKIALLRRLADMVGVDFDDVFKKG